jgi:hypothetical protein
MYAQSAYLVSIVCQQWACLLSAKTRNLSLSQQGLKNGMGKKKTRISTAEQKPET